MCEVERVGQMRFYGAAPREYYTLRPCFAKNRERIYTPTDTNIAMRPVMRAEEADACLNGMRAAKVKAFCSHKQGELIQHYQALMNGHCPADYMKVFKEISGKERRQKSVGKRLNATDQHFYRLTERLLSEELSIALHEPPEHITERLHQAAQG